MKPSRYAKSLFTMETFSLWQLLEVAMLAPTEVVLDDVWVELEGALETGDATLKLQIAGEAISQLSDVFTLRSQMAFDEIEATTAHDGPVMALDEFDSYVRQTMQIDLDSHIEPIEKLGLPAQPSEHDDSQSLVGDVPKSVLLSVLDELRPEPITEEEQMKIIKSLSHGEDVPLWSKRLNAYLQKRDSTKPMTLLDLPKALGMPFAEVWLTLLLGDHDYQLRRTGDDFYSASDIEVVLKSDLEPLEVNELMLGEV